MKDLKKPKGGRPGVTLDDVRAACARLEKQGRVVGAVNVRLELGRGSFTTLQQHLRTLGYASPGSRPYRKT
jgi:Plasmid replication region DNA-binding N-term